jgi:hypothetical protein
MLDINLENKFFFIYTKLLILPTTCVLVLSMSSFAISKKCKTLLDKTKDETLTFITHQSDTA